MKKASLFIGVLALIGLTIYFLSDPYLFTSAETLYAIGVEKSDEGTDVINTEELEVAAEFFERAISKGFKERTVFDKLGRAYAHTADNATQEEMYSRALKEYPDDFEFLFRRAESRMEQHKYKPTLEDYDKVVKLGSHSEYINHALYGRGAAWYLLGDTANAAKDFNALTRLTGNEWRDYEDYSKRFQ
ncbi:tetratricopeptide repeat protein [Rufibacter aurantiacus]|uniref:tetratricopeptide repeat protein n=1 Tax=Rufibacter aurantiacus TaxID=2817374 RepID=UPI001B302857|nr:tetratricopeptide repeat protein [Rufibacter aurantiacus]